MKIDDLKTAEWDGTWEIIWESEGKKILLLNLINMITYTPGIYHSPIPF